MKHIIITLFILFFAIQSNAQIVKAEIIATGLTCSMCSNSINKQLKSLSEVASVDTDLNTNTFTITMKPNSNVSPKLFKDNVEKAGFFVGSLVLFMDTNSVTNFINLEEKELSSSKEIKVQILDKGFVTDKEFKKLSKKYKNSTTYLSSNNDSFHYKILN